MTTYILLGKQTRKFVLPQRKANRLSCIIGVDGFDNETEHITFQQVSRDGAVLLTDSDDQWGEREWGSPVNLVRIIATTQPVG